MLIIFRKFFQAPVYEGDPERTQDARTTHRVSVALLGLGIFSIPAILLLESPAREFVLATTLTGIIIWLTAIYLVKREQRTLAKIIIIAVNTFNLCSAVFVSGGLTRAAVFSLLLLLALANLLFPRRGAVVYGVILLVLVSILYGLTLAGMGPEPTYTETARSIFLIFLFAVVSTAIVMTIASADFRHNLEASRRNEQELQERNRELDHLKNSLELQVADRTAELEKRVNQLDAIAGIARSTTSLQNLEELLSIITRLISERLDYHHTGIFLLDNDQEHAILRAASSDEGRKLLGKQYKLGLDSNSIISFVISRDEPRIAPDIGPDSALLDIPHLPNTRSEIVLPLRVGERVIGALDVHSAQPNAFKEIEINILSTLADQVAIAIENARLFGASREALKQSEETFSQYIKQEWRGFVSRLKNTGYTFNGLRVTPLDANESREKQNRLSISSIEKGSHELSIPIRIRGQVVGVLDVKPKNNNRKWTQDDITLLEAAAERTALAIENTRLVESSQRRASRERTIGEISAKIGAVTDLEAIMQTAVEELGRKIGGTAEVIFELGVESDGRG